MLPLVSHINLYDFLCFDGIPRLYNKGRVVHTELKLCKLGEDILERDADTVSWFDDEGALWFWRKAEPEERYDIISSSGRGYG